MLLFVFLWGGGGEGKEGNDNIFHNLCIAITLKGTLKGKRSCLFLSLLVIQNICLVSNLFEATRLIMEGLVEDRYSICRHSHEFMYFCDLCNL